MGVREDRAFFMKQKKVNASGLCRMEAEIVRVDEHVGETALGWHGRSPDGRH